MKKSIWIPSAPVVLAVVLLASYASVIFGVPAVAALFADFKMELLAPTMLAIHFTRLVTSLYPGVAFGATIFALTFVLAKRQKWAWNVGLALTLIFSLSLAASLLPLLTVMYGLNDGDAQSLTLQLLPQICGIAFVVFLPPLLFLVLRRAFLAMQPRRACAREIPRGA